MSRQMSIVLLVYDAHDQLKVNIQESHESLGFKTKKTSNDFLLLLFIIIYYFY
jgi:hypothetical protein